MFVISPVVAVEVYGQIWTARDPEGKAWNEARHGFPVRFFGRGCRDVLIRRAQGRGRDPKSLVSLSSVVLLQRSLIWILRALEVDAHAIRENGRIPGCGAEGKTSARDRCIFIRWKPARRRVRTRLPTVLHGSSFIFPYLKFSYFVVSPILSFTRLSSRAGPTKSAQISAGAGGEPSIDLASVLPFV